MFNPHKKLHFLCFKASILSRNIAILLFGARIANQVFRVMLAARPSIKELQSALLVVENTRQDYHLKKCFTKPVRLKRKVTMANATVIMAGSTNGVIETKAEAKEESGNPKHFTFSDADISAV